jgi:hypothetical protein
MASRWLEGNVHNRPVNQGHVERLAHEMKGGRWRLTHQGIAFGANGVLLDGQHRLWAIVMSDVTVPVRVFFNEPGENTEFIDGGVARSIADRISLSDRFSHNVGHKHLATLRCMVRGFRPIQRLSYSEEADLLAKHLDAITFAMEHLTTAERARGVATATTRAVIARAFYNVKHDRLIHFCDVLKSGLARVATDQPIILLRDYLTQCQKGRNELSVVREQYGKTQRALASFLLGKSLTSLHSVAREIFPLPEEIN